MERMRTDLAAELRELNPQIAGVTEQTEIKGLVSVSRIRIETKSAAEKLEKPIGNYVTLDVPALQDRDPNAFRQASKALAEELSMLLGPFAGRGTVLVAGLGNRFVTPDALGPRVVERVFITRHLSQVMPDDFSERLRAVCAIAPGVLGITGIETKEVIRGIVARVKPVCIIAIDALASRRASRISTTIQLTDTGICPGAGVGNARAVLDQKELGIPVFALGVPLVVYAKTVVRDAVSVLAEKTGVAGDDQGLLRLVDEVVAESMGPLIVTPKEVDVLVADMARIVADGINLALHGDMYEALKKLNE